MVFGRLQVIRYQKEDELWAFEASYIGFGSLAAGTVANSGTPRDLRVSHERRLEFPLQCIVLLATLGVAFGSGVLKDYTGGTYDLTTGQYSSAITGRVYNTAPYGYAAPYVPAYGYAAPYGLAAPYGVAAPLVYGGLYRR